MSEKDLKLKAELIWEDQENGFFFYLVKTVSEEIIGCRLLGDLEKPGGQLCDSFVHSFSRATAYVLENEQSFSFVNTQSLGPIKVCEIELEEKIHLTIKELFESKNILRKVKQDSPDSLVGLEVILNRNDSADNLEIDLL